MCVLRGRDVPVRGVVRYPVRTPSLLVSHMELGNLCFGHSRGAWPIPRHDGFEDVFAPLLEAVGGSAFADVPECGNATFTLRPYWWGDCTCGFAAREVAWEDAHPHAATCYQTAVRSLGHGRSQDREAQLRALCAAHGIPWNDGLGAAVHCTCTYPAQRDAFLAEDGHAPTCRLVLPNFVYHPDGTSIMWYKYPFRDAYASRALTVVAFATMIAACVASVVTDPPRALEPPVV